MASGPGASNAAVGPRRDYQGFRRPRRHGLRGRPHLDAVEQPAVDVREPARELAPGEGRPAPGFQFLGRQHPLLEFHVPGAGLPAARPGGDPHRVDFLEIPTDDEPEVDEPHGAVVRLHIVNLEDERSRDRVAEQVGQGLLGAGDLEQGRMLGIGIQTVLQERGGQPDARPTEFDPVPDDRREDGVLRVIGARPHGLGDRGKSEGGA